MFPKKATLDHSGFYRISGFGIDDDLIFAKSNSLNVNEEYQIWHGQDCKDTSEENNDGKHCVDVDISCLI